MPAPAPPAAPPPEISTIVVPIRASLAPLLPLIESQVPVRLDSGTKYELDPQQRFGVRYRVERAPLALTIVGSGLHAETTVRYAIEACRRTWNPLTRSYAMWPCVSCGFGEEPREARIRLHATAGWDPQWRLRTRTVALPAEFPRPCEVTMLDIDITRWRIAPLVDEQLAQLARSIDAEAPKLTSIRPVAQQVWTALQSPVEVAPRAWFLLEPAEVALGPIRGSGLEAASTLSLRARTSLVVGDRPVVQPKPLPPLAMAGPAEHGLRVAVDILVPYEEASRLMTAEFGGRTYTIAGRTLRVGSLKIAGARGGRIVIEAEIDYRGGALKTYRGPLRLEGTPLFDAQTSSVALADLDYEIDRRRHNPFLRAADRIAHESVRERLAASARWPVAESLARVRAEVERGINRPLSGGATLRGRVDALVPSSITPQEATLHMRVLATGSAEIRLPARLN